MEQLTVIKIGGNIIDDNTRLESFLEKFAAVEGKKILVHGGGKIATSIGDKLGIESKYNSGRRITDKETLDLVTMVYGGLVNKRVVAVLQGLSCNAVGLTGADGNVMLADRREVKEVDYGYVGDIRQTGINILLLQSLLNNELTPVMAPLTHDGQGSLLNTNADTIAQEIAKAMAKVMQVNLIYCFEKKGLLRDIANEDSVIEQINEATFGQLKADEVITDGMIPKVENALAAIRSNVSRVIIGHAEDLQALIAGTAGTQIQ